MKTLLQAIQERQQKNTLFGHGITTADRYVQNLQDMAGLDVVYPIASKGKRSFNDCLKEAQKTLVYQNEDMVVQEKAASKDLKGIELPKNTLMVFKHVLSTPRIDRDGDILKTEGAIPDPKMLLLWQHVHNLPIGKMLQIVEHNSKQLVLISAIVDMNELSHDAAVMVDNDMARFSHGFRALEWDQRKETEGETSGQVGFEIKKFEIMEESIVSVPSNVDAEISEVLVDLVEGGKLTSGIMKATGKKLRDLMPKKAAVTIDLKEGETDDTTEDTSESSEPAETVEAGSGEPAPKETETITSEDTNGAVEEQSTEVSQVEEVPVIVDATSTTTEEKQTEVTSEKAGKKLSAEYMKMLQDCVDDLKACLDTDKDMTRGTQAICERVVGKLGKMIESASESKPESDEAPPEKEASIITVKDAMAIFIANSSDADRSLMSAVLRTMDDIESKNRIAEQLKAFLNSK